MIPGTKMHRRNDVAYETVLYDVSDRICTITLNRPDKLNAWTRQMHLDVKDAMHTAGADPEVRVIILTGAGRGFCAGADMGGLQAISSGKSGVADRSSEVQDTLPGGSTLADFRMNYSYFPSIPKFIIAAINGPAAGLGFIIPLYADIRFAAESAVFTTAFAQRGLIAEHGVSWLLPRMVGLPAALDLLCSARKFRAPEALQLGLVNRVIADEKLMGETRAYATLLANTVSPRSVSVMKRQLWEAEFQTLSEATTQANHEMALSFATSDFKEGVAHFLEKRAARFTGK
jgi:enoyl-CoA hydratase/carnithine racemase